MSDTDIETAYAQGGHFVEDETDRILDAIDRAKDQGQVTYFTLDDGRVAAIVSVAAGQREEARQAGDLTPASRSMATEYASADTYNRGQRMKALAMQVTEDSYQRVIAWMQLAGQHATWTDDNGQQRLNWGGRTGSYCVPPGWWVVYVTESFSAGEPGFDGWSDADFCARWIEPSELARQQRLAAVAYGAMRGRH